MTIVTEYSLINQTASQSKPELVLRNPQRTQTMSQEEEVGKDGEADSAGRKPLESQMLKRFTETLLNPTMHEDDWFSYKFPRIKRHCHMSDVRLEYLLSVTPCIDELWRKYQLK